MSCSVKSKSVDDNIYGDQSTLCRIHNSKCEENHGSTEHKKAETRSRRRNSESETPSQMNEMIQEKYRFAFEFSNYDRKYSKKRLSFFL